MPGVQKPHWKPKASTSALLHGVQVVARREAGGGRDAVTLDARGAG